MKCCHYNLINCVFFLAKSAVWIIHVWHFDASQEKLIQFEGTYGMFQQHFRWKISYSLEVFWEFRAIRVCLLTSEKTVVQRAVDNVNSFSETAQGG